MVILKAIAGLARPRPHLLEEGWMSLLLVPGIPPSTHAGWHAWSSNIGVVGHICDAGVQPQACLALSPSTGTFSEKQDGPLVPIL